MGDQRTSEELREALLTTERLRAKAEQQQLENQVLLDGLTDVLRSSEPEAFLKTAFHRLHRVIDFDEGFILKATDEAKLLCIAASSSRFLDIYWKPGALFARVLGGESTTVFDISKLEEWQQQPALVRSRVSSSLYAPLEVDGSKGIVVLVSSAPKAFKKSHAALLKRFSLLAAQVVALVEAQNLRRQNVVLHAARRRAEQENHAKSAFLAAMSHELRTPMNGIFGMLDLLEQAGLPAEEAVYARILRMCTRDLLCLVNNILDYSKIEAGAMTVESIDFSVSELLTDVVDLFRAAVLGKGLELRRTGLDPTGVYLRGDPLRLRQILQNFVNNAIKFTEKGFIEVNLADCTRDGEQFRLAIQVRDTGPGIAKEALSRLFQPFSQADGTVSRKYGGTGLGLTICRSLAEAMGGAVGVDSEIGRGSCFWLEVVLPLGEVPTAQLVESQVTSIQQGVGSLGVRALVVDDNAVNRLILEKALRRAGCEVDLAESGSLAVEMVKRQRYEVVLLDYHMPGMDGPETVKAIRALGGWRLEVPFVAVSADVFEDAQARFHECGVKHFLTKPIEWSAMIHVLRGIWNN
ncbi:MAG: response regulator [Myxococcales bacterium]|nr:response regulator [Myxococcales bacterium]